MKSLVLLFTALVGTCSVLAQSASLTFQGQLGDSGRPASGNYDFVFRLFNAAANGSEVALSFAAPNVVVTNGYFTAQVDFGANAFAGGARWVQVEVRTNGSVAAFSPLLPRQALGAVPYALYALNGSPGPQGPAGPQGPQGTLGPTGATGPQGSQGLLGLTGAAGPAGVVGPQGPKGLVFRGAWNPATSYVLDDAVASGGSAWLAKRGNSNITPIEGADWTLLSKKGDAGTAGPAGPQGLQGVLGATGLTGATGPQGIQGGQGLTGATGPQGPAGGVDMTLATNFALLNVPDTSTQATAVAIMNGGFITGVTVTGQGNGYTAPPTITITDPAGSGAVLNPIISNSKLIGITVSNPGTGYTAPLLSVSAPPPFRRQIFAGDNAFTGNNTFSGDGSGLTNLGTVLYLTNRLTKFVWAGGGPVSVSETVLGLMPGDVIERVIIGYGDNHGNVAVSGNLSRDGGPVLASFSTTPAQIALNQTLNVTPNFMVDGSGFAITWSASVTDGSGNLLAFPNSPYDGTGGGPPVLIIKRRILK